MIRIGVIGIVISGDRCISIDLQKLLNEFQDIIVGRMGIPLASDGISTISLVVRGTNERISALTGKIGRFDSVYVKSAVTAVELNDTVKE